MEGGTLAPVEGPCGALAHGDDTLDGRWHDREINGGTVEGLVGVEETKDVKDRLKGAVREKYLVMEDVGGGREDMKV